MQVDSITYINPTGRSDERTVYTVVASVACPWTLICAVNRRRLVVISGAATILSSKAFSSASVVVGPGGHRSLAACGRARYGSATPARLDRSVAARVECATAS